MVEDRNRFCVQKDRTQFTLLKRFCNAWALLDLVQEMPLQVVEKKHNLPRGELQVRVESLSLFIVSSAGFFLLCALL